MVIKAVTVTAAADSNQAATARYYAKYLAFIFFGPSAEVRK